jgi:hypothetical protein
MLTIDLLDLSPSDTQATRWQEHVSHLVRQAPAKRLAGLLWLQDEGQVEHLGQLKQPIELLAHPFGRLGAQYLALTARVRFDFIEH